jgi:cytochrome c peroxidase
LYNNGDGLNDPYLDEHIQPLALTEPEIDDFVAFLASLTGAQYREQREREHGERKARIRPASTTSYTNTIVPPASKP